jgi:hypothetical protein
MCADETKAKLMGAGRKVLHFICSHLPALVMLPLGAWVTVSHLSPTLLHISCLKDLAFLTLGPAEVQQHLFSYMLKPGSSSHVY